MKIGEAVKINQKDVYKKLSKYRHKKHRRRRGKPNKDKLTFSDIEKLMRHDSYARGPGGAIRQKTWGR